jgi:hypothetical protein
MRFGRLSLDGGGGDLGVGGEEDRDRPGGGVAVEHVSVQVPRLHIDGWQIVPVT